jgi:hypothetical protein
MKIPDTPILRSLLLVSALYLFAFPFAAAQQIEINQTRRGVMVVDSTEPGKRIPVHSRTTTQLVEGARIEPLVVRKGVDTYRLVVIVDPAVKGLQIRTSSMLERGNDAPEWLRLYDDGTKGDEFAGDKQFTIDSLTLPPSFLSADTLPIGGVTLGISSARVEYEDGSTGEESITFYPKFPWIDPARAPNPQVHDVAPDIRASDYCMNIVVAPDPSLVNETSVIAKYFDAGGEEKDFIFLETPFYSWGLAGYSVTVSNDVQGIGVDIFDYSAAYGSEGKLKSWIRTFSMSLNPGLLNHELLHHWAAFLDAGFGFGLSHWGAIERPTTGFGNYWGAYKRFETVSAGKYRGFISNPEGDYSDLELYLMGLVSDSDVVTPIRAIPNATPGNNGTDPITRESYREIAGDPIKEVRMQDIIARHGPRIPGVAHAQKEFSSALIVAYDRQLTGVEFAYFDFLMRQYEQPLPSYRTSFEKATGGRASMSTRLASPPPLPSPVQLLSPPDDAHLGCDSVWVRWLADTPSVISYWLEYATDSLFLHKMGDSTLSDSSYTIRNLRSGDTYWWRVKARNISGWGPFSQARRFSVLFTGVQDENSTPTKFALHQNYPNPFNPLTIIKYTIAGGGGSGLGARNTSLVVYDALGREVAVLVNERKQPGHYEVIFDGSKLSSGVYFYRMEAGSFVSTRKLLLVR